MGKLLTAQALQEHSTIHHCISIAGALHYTPLHGNHVENRFIVPMQQFMHLYASCLCFSTIISIEVLCL